jgi:DNA-binding MarR family transcriptional regulator
MLSFLVVPTASPPATDSPAAFAEALEAFFRAVRRARAARAGERALSIAQYHLLEPLAVEGTRAVGALAEEAGIAAPTATKMLDGLVRDGYVTRTTAPHDRRVVLIALTGKGDQALAERRARVAAARRRIHAQLTPAEREQASALLHRLAEVVEDL